MISTQLIRATVNRLLCFCVRVNRTIFLCEHVETGMIVSLLCEESKGRA
jgi:hypothetical protein